MDKVEIDRSRHYFKSAEEYLTFNLGFVIEVCEVSRVAGRTVAVLQNCVCELQGVRFRSC